MSALEPCYVFSPPEDTPKDRHASKRRKVASTRNESHAFTNAKSSLLRGAEPLDLCEARLEAFQRLWEPQEATLKRILHNTGRTHANDVSKFIDSCTCFSPATGLQAGLLISAPGAGIPPGFIEATLQETQSPEQTLHIELSTAQSSNVKNIMKSLNQEAINHDEQQQDMLGEQSSADTRLLNYDLEILHRCVERSNLQRVLVVFQDAEALESNTLSDVLSLFNAWRDRIPFLLCFGIKTSIEFFEAKLSDQSIERLVGKSFEVEDLKAEKLFTAVLGLGTNLPNQGGINGKYPALSSGHPLWLGSGLCQRMMIRLSEGVSSPLGFIKTLKYVHMSHFFANPLSLAIGGGNPSASFTEQHWDAVRCLPSFKLFCENRLNAGKYADVARLLADNEFLSMVFNKQLTSVSGAIYQIVSAVMLLQKIQPTLLKQPSSVIDMYISAMAGQLAESESLNRIMLSLRRASSSTLLEFLEHVMEYPSLYEILAPSRNALQSLLHNLSDQEDPDLRSGHDIQHQNVRTTIVAQKVELSQQAARLTEAETTYTKILDQINDSFKAFLLGSLKNPHRLFPIEVLVYDLPSVWRDVTAPQSRFAIERGLSQCHDYLGREYCRAGNDVCSARQPATPVLYRLYLECGNLFSVTDLWSAFWAVMKPQVVDDEKMEKEKVLGLFEIGLAELKKFGMIKQSRKQIDSLVRITWKGL